MLSESITEHVDTAHGFLSADVGRSASSVHEPGLAKARLGARAIEQVSMYALGA